MNQLNKFLDEFKQFAIKGNVIDLAVGIIIGGAFSQITKSLVDDVIMPPIGLILGKVDFSNLYLNLSGQNFSSLKEAQDAGAPIIMYGSFLQVLLDFIILALIIFILIKWINNLKRTEEGVKKDKPINKTCPYCFTTISIKATRCPNCTSRLNDTSSK